MDNDGYDSEEMQVQQFSKKIFPTNISKKRVAVVDDDEDIRKIVSLILKKAGHEIVITASNGEEIVDLVANGGPNIAVDLILMDYSMPKMNGMEASRIIASKKPGTKIIFVSAADIQREVEEKGFAFIAKPFSINKLLDLVNK